MENETLSIPYVSRVGCIDAPTTLPPTQPPTQPPTPKPNNKYILYIEIGVGALVVIGVLIGICMCCKRGKNTNNRVHRVVVPEKTALRKDYV